MILLLGPEELKGLLTIKEAVEAMEQGLTDWAQDPQLGALRRRVHSPWGARVTVHQGAPPSAQTTGITVHCELVRVHAEGRQTYGLRGRPVRVIYDAQTAELLAILVGEPLVQELPTTNAVVAVPTAAVAAVGTKHLARANSKVVGVLGAGGQARHHLAAFAAVFPLERAKVFSPTPENRVRFAREMGKVLGFPVEAVESSREAIQGVDIVVTATNSNVPTFDGAWLEPGMHVTSVVSSNKELREGGFITAMRREVDDTTLRRADIIVANSKEQERLDRPGILWEPIEQGVIKWEKVWDLGEVLSGGVLGRTNEQQITFFKNNAFWGIGDQVIGRRLYEKALHKGIGTQLPFDGAEYREP